VKFKLPFLIIGALFLAVALLLVAGISPIEAGYQLVLGSLGSTRALTDTLRNMTPMLIAGTAIYLALRAGLFNIGVEGQLLLGAMVATFIGLKMPGLVGIILGTIAAMIAGALWALPAGLIKAYRGGHEVITTIMLNSIAGFLVAALVSGPFKDPTQEGPTTAFLSENTRIPALFSMGKHSLTINFALLMGLILFIGFMIWLKRTVSGYELKTVGANPKAARAAGVNVEKVIVKAMVYSGAIAGLAGAFQALAYTGRFYQGFSPGYGFDALGVALLAGNTPGALLATSFLFGALNKGASVIQLFGVPKGFGGVLLGLLIICFAAYRYRKLPTYD